MVRKLDCGVVDLSVCTAVPFVPQNGGGTEAQKAKAKKGVGEITVPVICHDFNVALINKCPDPCGRQITAANIGEVTSLNGDLVMSRNTVHETRDKGCTVQSFTTVKFGACPTDPENAMANFRTLCFETELCDDNFTVKRGSIDDCIIIEPICIPVECGGCGGKFKNTPTLTFNPSFTPTTSPTVSQVFGALQGPAQMHEAQALNSCEVIAAAAEGARCFFCILACELGAKACIAGTSGAGIILCLLAQVACEAACIESHSK